VKRYAHFGSNNAGHCGFAKTWGACQQNMVCSLPALLGSSEHNVKMLFQFTLPDEVIKQSRT
jgi:hypothetical protein